MAVQSVLETLAIPFQNIELGKIKLQEAITTEKQKEVDSHLRHFHLELMEDKKAILAERIKVLIIDLFHSSQDDLIFKLSEYLSKSLNYDYTYLSNIFSETEESTIERFYITTRIERAKELLIYEDLSITEIAYKLNYSSVSHLSRQFKKVIGLTPSMFKKKCESEDYVWRTCE